jgi:oxygen-independent coproporphyrinogen-3 oxidase
LEGRSAVEESETVTKDREMADTIMLGLRLIDGVDRGSFQRRFGLEIGEAYASTIEYLEGVGLLQTDPTRIRLTERGRLLGNEVFQRFLASD